MNRRELLLSAGSAAVAAALPSVAAVIAVPELFDASDVTWEATSGHELIGIFISGKGWSRVIDLKSRPPELGDGLPLTWDKTGVMRIA